MKQEFFDEQFELRGATPAAWVLNARRLKRSADVVFNAWISDVERMADGVSPLELDDLEVAGCAMLLYGLSLENLVKGILVEVDSSVVMNGEIGKWPGGRQNGHYLPGLFERADISLDSEEQDLIARLTAFVLWAGRYPIPMKSRDMALRQIHLDSPFLPLPMSVQERASFNKLYESLESRLVSDG